MDGNMNILVYPSPASRLEKKLKLFTPASVLASESQEYRNLLALDPATVTHEEIDKALGQKEDHFVSFCTECGQKATKIVELEGSEWDMAYCFSCIEKAYNLLKDLK
jgi:hypothetical protein